MMAAVKKATRSDTQRPPLRVRAELLAAATTAQLSYVDALDADIDRRRAVQRAAPLRTLRRVAPSENAAARGAGCEGAYRRRAADGPPARRFGVDTHDAGLTKIRGRRKRSPRLLPALECKW